MATFEIGISGNIDVTGSTNFKVKYRLAGDSIWSSYLIPVPPTSGTTAWVPQFGHGLDNRIYEFQIQNLNGADNPLSLIWKDCGITDPNPDISPVSDGVGYSFDNLSEDIDSYNVQLTTVDNPGVVIAIHTLPAGAYPGTISDSFTGLDPLTLYRLVITPVADTFSSTFVHIFRTTDAGTCPDPIAVTASLIE